MPDPVAATWITPDAAAIAARLRSVGIAVAPDSLGISEREDRLAAMLPGDMMAWFATTLAGAG